MNQLRKSKHNKMMLGVFGGIGEYFGIDPTILRIIFIFVVFVTDGLPVVLYFLIGTLAMPSALDSDGEGTYTSQHTPSSTPTNRNFSEEESATPDPEITEEDWGDF